MSDAEARMNEIMAAYPPAEGPAVGSPGKPILERVVVTTADGREFDFGRPGKPGSPRALLFSMKVRKYKWIRRHEFQTNKT